MSKVGHVSYLSVLQRRYNFYLRRMKHDKSYKVLNLVYGPPQNVSVAYQWAMVHQLRNWCRQFKLACKCYCFVQPRPKEHLQCDVAKSFPLSRQTTAMVGREPCVATSMVTCLRHTSKLSFLRSCVNASNR